MATTSVRDWLLQQGVKNDQIGYNKGMVTLGGRNFMSATPSQDGRAYASADDLTRAYNAYNAGKQKESLNQRNDSIYNEIAGLRSQLTQPQQSFSYDPNSDPQYQAALRQARQNAQTGTNNALVSLGSRGIGNSSSAVTAANQIQQSEFGRVSDTLLPQLMQQAYQRYQNDRTAQRQALMDQLGLLETQYGMNQQTDSNLYRDQAFDRSNFESDRNFNRGVLESDRAFDRGVLESDRSFDRGVLESDRNFNRGVLESDRSYGLQRSNLDLARDDNARQWAQFNYQKEQAEAAKAQQNAVDLDQERRGLVTAIRSGEITPGQALQQIEEDLALGFYTPDQAEVLKRDLQTIAPNVPQPQQTPQQATAQEDFLANLPSDREIEAEAKRLGYPVIDYKAYAKDPKGMMTGLSFKQWQQLYGPQMR